MWQKDADMEDNIACAYMAFNTIDLNIKSWLNLHPAEKKNVIVHEVCHLIVTYLNYNNWSVIPHHGKEWVKCMLNAGETPIPYWNASRVYYQAKCDCVEAWVANSFVAQKCVECKQNIIYTGDVKKFLKKDVASGSKSVL